MHDGTNNEDTVHEQNTESGSSKCGEPATENASSKCSEPTPENASYEFSELPTEAVPTPSFLKTTTTKSTKFGKKSFLHSLAEST